jgi:small subunit ribosomal protein S20
MANRRSSIKKIRADKRRRENNLRAGSELKTVARKVREFISAKNISEAQVAFRVLFSKLDRAVKKNVLHANRASRVKSRIQTKINALAKSSK